MRMVSVSSITEGDVLGNTIYDSQGRVLLGKGVKLTPKLVSNLERYGIASVYIVDEECPIEPEDIIKPEVRAQAVGTLKQTATSIMRKSIVNPYEVTKNLEMLIDEIIDELINKKGSIVNLVDLKDYDNYTFSHSVNVAVLSLVTGVSLGYNNEKLKKLGIGALLHDLGKIFIPIPILNKPGKLTDDEFSVIKTHPEKGFAKSKIIDALDATGRAAILQHHERIDGSGYPDGRKGDEIHEFAKIVAAADVYDAITSDRPYRKRWAPNEGVEYLLGTCGSHLDFSVVSTFSKHIAPYPLGCKVKMSNGEEGYVINNKLNPKRPMIQVGSSVIDLSRELSLTITELMA